jgi:hypothetical protein
MAEAVLFVKSIDNINAIEKMNNYPGTSRMKKLAGKRAGILRSIPVK